MDRAFFVAVIDSGIDYASQIFGRQIEPCWKGAVGSVSRAGRGRTPPEGYAIGAEYTQEQINEALRQPTLQERGRLVPSVDTSGHGTAVAESRQEMEGIAARYVQHL